MKKRPESLAVELVRIWGQLDPVDEWRPVLDQAAAGLRRLAAVEAERDQLRQRVEALTDDALARVLAGWWTSALNEATQPLYASRGVELGPLRRREAQP